MKFSVYLLLHDDNDDDDDYLPCLALPCLFLALLLSFTFISYHITLIIIVRHRASNCAAV
jgi:hypothetical protein